MVKRAHDMAEDTRNSIRQSRREGNEGLKKLEHDKEIGQDDEHRAQEEVQRVHDHYIAKISETLEHKEEDIMTV
jgi:ribosome recycling factor